MADPVCRSVAQNIEEANLFCATTSAFLGSNGPKPIRDILPLFQWGIMKISSSPFLSFPCVCACAVVWEQKCLSDLVMCQEKIYCILKSSPLPSAPSAKWERKFFCGTEKKSFYSFSFCSSCSYFFLFIVFLFCFVYVNRFVRREREREKNV